MIYDSGRIRAKSNGIYLRQDAISVNHGNIVNIHIYVSELDTWSSDLNTDFTLCNCFICNCEVN